MQATDIDGAARWSRQHAFVWLQSFLVLQQLSHEDCPPRLLLPPPPPPPVPSPWRTRRRAPPTLQALHLHIQLRGFLRRHRQLRQVCRAVPPNDPFQQLALRRDVLPPPHRPGQQRPHYPGLRCRRFRFALRAAVHGAREGLQQGRKLRRRRGDGSGPGLLPAAEHLLGAPVQHLHECPARVVPAAAAVALQHHARMRGVPGQVPLLHGRVRRERLHLPPGCQQDRGANQSLRSNRRQRHRPRCREADPARRQAHRGAGDPADGLHPDRADAVRELQQGGLRQLRVPHQVQRPVALPRRAPLARGQGAPEQVPARKDFLRRLLPPRPHVRAQALHLRVRRQLAAGGVLRGRRRVQLQPRRRLRVPRRDGVRGPVEGGELGRHPPHGARLQGRRRDVAARTLRRPADKEPGLLMIHRPR